MNFEIADFAVCDQRFSRGCILLNCVTSVNDMLERTSVATNVGVGRFVGHSLLILSK